MNAEHLEAFMLGFARCVGCVARAPGFSHQSVPPPLRAAFAFVLAVGLVARFNPSAGGLNGRGFVLALITELLVGAAIGFAASMLYEGASAGGKLLDTYVGVQGMNPTAQVAAGDGFGGLWGIVFLAAFFFLDGYRYVIDGLTASLDAVPLGGTIDAATWRHFGFALPATMMRSALLVAGPSIVLGVVAQLGLGAIARVIPRFSNVTLSFPIVFGSVLLATLATLPFLLAAGGRPLLVLPFPY